MGGTQSVCSVFGTGLLVVLMCSGTATGQTTAFTYQGQLTDAGTPVNGSYDLQVALFDNATGGTQIGATLTRTSVAVGSGVFTVQLDFGGSAFPGANRFLEIGVRPAGGGSFTTLAPRQQISSTPYAIRALSATTADTLSSTCTGCVQDSQIQSVTGSKVSGTIPVASVPTSSTNYIQNTTTQQANANFNISGNGSVGGTLLASNAGIGTTTPSEKLTIQTATQNYGFVHTDGAVTVGSFVSSQGGWLGTKSNHPLYFFTSNGAASMTLSGGNVGIGTTSPTSARLQVRAGSGNGVFGSSTDGVGVAGHSDNGTGVTGTSDGGDGVYGESKLSNGYGVHGVANTGGTARGVFGESTDGAGVYGSSPNGAGVAGLGGTAGLAGAPMNSNGAGVMGFSGNGPDDGPDGTGVVGSALSGTGVRGQSETGTGVRGESEAVSSFTIAGVVGEATGNNNIGVRGVANVGAGSWGTFGESTHGAAIVGQSADGLLFLGVNPDQAVRYRVTANGNVFADGSYNCGLGSGCFNTGTGADVAERIDTSQVLHPGDLVEIDPARADHYRLASSASSTLVAGVVSTNPGMTMNNNDLAANDAGVRTDTRPLLALVGKVPVKATAEGGAIHPGDLLVASSTPGRAMKAASTPAMGSVVGKALEPLDGGSGVIKMLVMLR